MMTAYATAQRALPAYAHRYSPKKFTQHQLFACLVLKEFLKADYRGIVNILADCPNLCAAIELEHVPHYTTLQKAADRLLKKTPRIASWIKRLSQPPTRRSSKNA
jgi:3-methyladenine DNA glycosylase/8-oxoguanine DNA glycosylase